MSADNSDSRSPQHFIYVTVGHHCKEKTDYRYKMKIYKYFNFTEDLTKDKKIESFVENYLWFSKPKYFNDPFDCNMEIINKYNEFLNLLADGAKDFIIENTKDFGICCFSTSNDNIHMWSHYAESHKGICLEYDSTNFEDYFSNLLKCKCRLFEVDYRKEFIDLNGTIEIEKNADYTRSLHISQIIKDPKLMDTLFEKLLCQKLKKVWSNENELRLILGGLARKNNKDKELLAGYKIPINRDLITGITFGFNTPSIIKEKIKEIFGSGMEYRNVELDYDNNTLKIK